MEEKLKCIKHCLESERAKKENLLGEGTQKKAQLSALMVKIKAKVDALEEENQKAKKETEVVIKEARLLNE